MTVHHRLSHPLRTVRTVEGRTSQDAAEYVVIDLETTGLGHGARILEIACVVLRSDGAVVAESESVVDPGSAVGPTWLHGITMDMAAEAPRFVEVASHFEEILRGRIHVAHNLAFDRRILRYEFARLGVTYPMSHGGICTADLARRCLGTGELRRVCKILGIDHEDPHRAMPDALAAAAVFRRLMIQAPSRRPCPPFAGSWRLPLSASLMPRDLSSYRHKRGTAVAAEEGDR